MATINPGKQLSSSTHVSGRGEDFAETFRGRRSWTSTSGCPRTGGQYGLHDKYEPGQEYSPDTFVDPEGFRAAVERLEQLYLAQLESERQ